MQIEAQLVPMVAQLVPMITQLVPVVCRWFRFAQLAKGKKFRP
jgi:hypothetical protein